MDSFFVSVELLERPELLGKPVVVAHPGARSVISSASYESRVYGIHSAMPLEHARRRCRDLVVIEPTFSKYRTASRAVMEVFREFTPLVEPLSIDEAFLDVAGSLKLFGTPLDIAKMIRARVRDQTGLPSSVGIATTKFVAKLASTRAKPDGVLQIMPEETLSFLHALPVQAMWGVGESTSAKLLSRGIRTVGDIANEPLESLGSLVGVASALKLHNLSHGRDERAVETIRDVKSIGHEETFLNDLEERPGLERVLLRLSGKTAVRLRERELDARTISLKLRWGNFDTITRARTLTEPTQSTQRVYAAARELFDSVWSEGKPVRLIGVRAEQLVTSGSEDIGLWNEEDSWRAIEQTVDEVRGRFGEAGLKPARLLETPDD